jgi:rubrerythrin
MTKRIHHHELVRLLQAAHSGELAAALAYRGHWKSLRDAEERSALREIEADEWSHRERVGRLLDELGGGPLRRKEVVAWLIGRTVGFLCHFTGWLMPMYMAGKVESSNVAEYLRAALQASTLGLDSFAIELQAMASKEADHERFFMLKVLSHPLTPLVQVVMPWPEARRETESTDSRVN